MKSCAHWTHSRFRQAALPVWVAGTSITAVFMAARSFARQSRQSSCLLLKGARCGADWRKETRPMSEEFISRDAALRAIFVRICRYPIDSSIRLAYENALEAIGCLPAADVVPVVRCKACAKHYVVNGRDMCARNAQGSGTHWIGLTATSPDAFCSRGERKGVNDDA